MAGAEPCSLRASVAWPQGTAPEGVWNDAAVIDERALERRAAGRAAITVLQVMGLWVGLVVLYPVTVVAMASVSMPPHPSELLALAAIFAIAGGVATPLILRSRR